MTPALTMLAYHLWQSTIFAAFAALLVLLTRKNHARVRYRLWFAASLKFLVPFSLLVAAGRQIEWRPEAPAAREAVAVAINEVSRPFSPPEVERVVESPVSEPLPVGEVLLGVWLCGALLAAGRWTMQWRRIRVALKAARPVDLRIEIPVRSSNDFLEPGVFGVWRPVLVLPPGISHRLTATQLQAVVAHELCHVRRRDNLASAIHMFVEAAFWFHPLVWWLGARMVEERERACDEEVIRQGTQPEVYAESILNVCRLYLRSETAFVAGVADADLKQRIERIMSRGVARNLSVGRKLLLAVAGVAAIAVPIAIGMIDGPRLRAQAHVPGSGLRFEVATVKVNKSGDRGMGFPPPMHGTFRATNVPLRMLIIEAYQIQEYQLTGGPTWLDSERFDILAKGPSTARRSEVYEMLQTLLADRFGLAIRRETREMSLYAITVDKGGPKMPMAGDEDCGEQLRDHPCGGFNMQNRSHLYGERVGIKQLADMLAFVMGRVVTDNTGLKGNYNIKLDWTPDDFQGRGAERPDVPPGSLEGPNVFAAMREQLGLKLESRKGPVEMLIVERAEKPSGDDSDPQQPSFDVASIKESHETPPFRLGVEVLKGGRLHAENVTLRFLIEIAYQVPMLKGFVSGGPEWLDKQRYYIDAKGSLPDDLPRGERMRRMLRDILADRFQLRMRHETKEMPIYALVAAKGDAKLTPAAERDCSESRACHGLHGGRANGLTGNMLNMQDLAEELTTWTDRAVVDATGIKGNFDITIPGWSDPMAPVSMGVASGREAAPDPSSPDLFTTLQRTLGLKLESRKGPVETYVIERVEKPSEN